MRNQGPQRTGYCEDPESWAPPSLDAALAVLPWVLSQASGSLWSLSSREADQPRQPERLGSKALHRSGPPVTASELGAKQARGGKAASAKWAKRTKTGTQGRAG